MNKRQKKERFKKLVTGTIPALVVASAASSAKIHADEIQSVASNALAQTSTQPPPPPPPPDPEPFRIVKGLRQ